MARELDARETIFVAEYLAHLDPKKAALAAGYSPSVAASKAYQWVSNSKVKPHVYAAIQEARQQRVERLQISADQVLGEIARLGFVNICDYVRIGKDGDPFVDLSSLDRDKGAGIIDFECHDYLDGRGEEAREVRKIRIRLNPNKFNALVKLGEHVGLFRKDGGDPDRAAKLREIEDENLRIDRMAEIARRYYLPEPAKKAG